MPLAPSKNAIFSFNDCVDSDLASNFVIFLLSFFISLIFRLGFPPKIAAIPVFITRSTSLGLRLRIVWICRIRGCLFDKR
ncbi:unnamed protein product [Citrullus colocynthis]|uniref:Uncharacterized protein n=1 Tax=Citrullus colocynthis TaxID=252529 RepID=A0ABP0ZDC3_9ROSI